MLPIESLHELHHGVTDELKVREQCALLVIKEVKNENRQMFEDKIQAIKDRDEEAQHRQQLEEAITKACSKLPKL